MGLRILKNALIPDQDGIGPQIGIGSQVRQIGVGKGDVLAEDLLEVLFDKADGLAVLLVLI